MHADQEDFLALAERVRRGDAAAADRLRQELEPRLVVVVGRALSADSAALPLTRWIRAQAHEVSAAAGQRPGRAQAWLIALLARRVCEWLVERLRSGACSTRLLQETVCA
jgi:hypothetical protein